MHGAVMRGEGGAVKGQKMTLLIETAARFITRLSSEYRAAVLCFIC